jgi:hypothetical protein
MIDRAAIKKRIQYHRTLSDAEGELILKEEKIEFSFLNEHLRKYILYRLHFDPAVETDEDFNNLLKRSLEEAMSLHPDLLAEERAARSCDGASTLVTKKALLLQSIQRKFDIRLDAFKAVEGKTLTDISQVVWEAMEQYPAWKDKLVYAGNT